MRERRSTSLSRGLALLILASGLTLSRAAQSYIFTEEPILRSSPASGEGDFFGYAIALHRVDDSGPDNDFDHAIMNTEIIVGAPSGTFPGGLTFIGLNDSGLINRTGLVYECPVVPGDCRALRGNEAGNDIRMFDYEGNRFVDDLFNSGSIIQDENKEGQFMGATIVSSGYHVMICAPRWINLVTTATRDFDRTRGHGRCFFSGRDLTNFEELIPCFAGSATSEGGQSYCMAGTSAAVYEDESSSNFTLLLGGPPFMTSNGAVFEYSLMANEEIIERVQVPRFEHGDGFVYGGFSVALGRIFGSDGRDLISALPKNNNYRGSVRVFNTSTRMPQVQVDGEQMGEYFGWVVATADLNGDSYDEIIVGAPLFSTPDKIEKGRIFVYRNNGTLDTENPIVITGTVNKGRFGSAIVNLGDINSDGFEDIAVSAPFEDHITNGAEGSVYIFLGSGDTYINREPEDLKYDERITALQISDTLNLQPNDYLQSFGYSLSSGVDVDANFNYDLAIGGYKQQAVILLRTMSIANISLSLATYPAMLLEYTIQTCNLTTESTLYACFQLEISADLSGRGLNGRDLDVAVTVTENPVSSGDRLFFVDSNDNRVDSYNGFLNLTTTKLTKENVTIYVKNDISDRRRPLSVEVTISPLERQPRSVNGNQDIIDLRDIPILNVLPQNNLEQELTLAGCANLICEPDLVLVLKETLYDGINTSNGFDLIAGDNVSVEIMLEYKTLSDDASNAIVIVELPPDVFRSPQNSISGECDLVRNGMYECSLVPIISDYEGAFNLTLEIPLSDEFIGNEDDFNIVITVNSSDVNDPDPSNNVVTIPTSISASNKVALNMLAGPNVTYSDDNQRFGELITFRVDLFGNGPSNIPSSELVIYFPGRTDLTGDFYFLYPAVLTSNHEDVTCTGVNPDDFKEFNLPSRRRRRNTPSESVEELYRMIRGEHREQRIRKREVTESVDCERDRGLCTPITCTINDLVSGLSIDLVTRVDQRFFQSQSGDFKFNAYATFNVMTDFFDLEEESSSAEFFIKEGPQNEPDTIPIFVFIISAVVGLILLVLIIITLFLLVIFLRRRTKKKIRRATERRRSLHVMATSSTGGRGAVVTSLDEKPDKPALEDSLDKPPLSESAMVETDAGEDPEVETEI